MRSVLVGIRSACAETARSSRAPDPARLGVCVLLLALAACTDEGEVSRAQAQTEPPPITVEITTVNPQLLRDVVALTGQLEAENSVLLKPEIEGVVEEITFREGEPVAAGDVLVRLKDAEQEARLAEARAAERLALDTYERTQRLARQDAASAARRTEAEALLDEARARLQLAELEFERTRIRAPFDGVTGIRRVAPGDRVEPEDGLVEVHAVDRLQLVFTVQEMGVPLARTGAPVQARVVAWPDERFPGEVFFVSPTIDPATRRLVLKAWVPNPDRKLKPGMFANVDVEIARKPDALLVPEAAVVYDRHGTYVWRVQPDDRVEKIPVEIGIRQQGQVEILSGLRPGERVVAAGTNKLMAGRRVQPPPGRVLGAKEGASTDAGERGGAG